MKTQAELIQDYIEGMLSEQELLSFESRLRIDPSLREELEMQQKLFAVIEKRLSMHNDEEVFRQHLISAERSVRYRSLEKPRISTFNRYKWIVSAAAVIVILVCVRLFFSMPDRLYSIPRMSSEIVRGEVVGDQVSQYETAVAFFNEGNYEGAREVLSNLISQDSSVVQYQYYYAVSYVGDQNWDRAIHELRPIREGTSAFRHYASYYTAVAYYEKGEYQHIHELIGSIPHSSGVYDDGQKILNKITR